jgi:chemotaxis signal transduction protein
MNAAQPGTDSKSEEKPRLRDLFSFVAGGRIFAVLAEEVEGTADAKYAALLPHAPPAVVGVLCVRGRMLTTLDPIALVTGRRLEWPPVIPSVVALRGDEQLALAAESFGGTITVAEADIEVPAEDGDRNHPESRDRGARKSVSWGFPICLPPRSSERNGVAGDTERAIFAPLTGNLALPPDNPQTADCPCH